MGSLASMSILKHLRRIEILAFLERRDFRFLAAAYFICKASDAVYYFAFSRILLEEIVWRGDSPPALTIGSVIVATTYPLLFMPPLAGVLADRLDRKSLMLFSLVARVPILAALMVVGHAFGLTELDLAVAGILLTSAGQLFYPARAAMVPSLLTRRELVAGNASLTAGWQPIDLAGATAAGLLVAAMGGLNALGLARAAYAVAALLILGMNAPGQAERRAGIGKAVRPYARPVAMVKVAMRDVAISVYFMIRHPLLRAIAIVEVLYSALFSSVLLIGVVQFINEFPGAGLDAFNLFRDVWGVWILLTLPAVPWLARRFGDGKMSLLAFAAMGVVLGLLPIVGLRWQALVLAALLGVLSAGMLPLHSVLQAETPDCLRGRVLANIVMIEMLARGSTAALLTVLIELTSATPIFLATGLAIFISGVALLAVKDIREIHLAAPERLTTNSQLPA